MLSDNRLPRLQETSLLLERMRERYGTFVMLASDMREFCLDEFSSLCQRSSTTIQQDAVRWEYSEQGVRLRLESSARSGLVSISLGGLLEEDARGALSERELLSHRSQLVVSASRRQSEAVGQVWIVGVLSDEASSVSLLLEFDSTKRKWHVYQRGLPGRAILPYFCR